MQPTSPSIPGNVALQDAVRSRITQRKSSAVSFFPSRTAAFQRRSSATACQSTVPPLTGSRWSPIAAD